MKEIKYFQSDIIENFLFNSLDKVKSFDTFLTNFCNNPEAISEFREVMNQYASDSAVDYAINTTHKFHYDLTGEWGTELLEYCETVDGKKLEDYDLGDCYTEVMNYIFNKIRYGEK